MERHKTSMCAKDRKRNNNNTRISCVDLFCGAGGLTHGLIQGGIDVKAGIDLDSSCKYPYEANNGDAVFIEEDITNMSSQEVERLFERNSIRMLAGCAPCQPFSTYARRYDSERDDKWALLDEFKRLVVDVRPDVVTMENVPSILQHRVFKRFVKTLQKLQYAVWYDVVECTSYGVPQTRKRTVLLASRLGQISLIEPTHKKPRTVKQAIGRLKPIRAGESGKIDKMHAASELSSLNLARIKASKPGGTWRDWPKRLVADCHRQKSGNTYPSVYGRMEWGKPAPTLTTQCYGYGNGRFGHPEQHRAISLREAAILQGFPRQYKFVPPGEPIEFRTIGRLVGNAVPVDLGRAIALSVNKHIKEIKAVSKRRKRNRSDSKLH